MNTNPNRNRKIELSKQHQISKNSYKQDPSDTNSMNNVHDELDMTITNSLNLQIPWTSQTESDKIDNKTAYSNSQNIKKDEKRDMTLTLYEKK